MKITINQIEKIKIALATLVVVLTTSLLYFKTVLHSDALFLEFLCADIFSGGNWKDWRFCAAPSYLPDMLLYFSVYKILPDAAWRIFFVSAAQVFMLTATVVWVARKIHPKISSQAISIILLMIAFVTLVAAKSNMWLYFYSTNNHFASLIVPLCCLGLYIKFFEKPSLAIASVATLIGGLAKASTALYLISFTIPAFIFIIITIVILKHSVENYKSYRNKLIGILVILTSSHLLSILFEKLLTYHNPLEGRVPMSIFGAINSFKIFLIATLYAFHPNNLFALSLSLLVSASFVFLIYKLKSNIKFNKNGWTISFYSPEGSIVDWKFLSSVFLLFIVFPLNIMGIIISGGFVDVFAYRYLTFPIALTIILTVILMNKSRLKIPMIWNVVYLILSIVIISSSFQYIKDKINNFDPIKHSPGYGISTYLKNIEKNGFVLQAGMADYWNAKAVEVLLPKNPILATSNDKTPFFCLSTIGPLLHPSHYSNHKYNFVILRNESHGDLFNYNKNTIGKLLPVPTKIHSFPGAEIWLYESEELDIAIKASINSFLWKKKMTPNFLILGLDLPGEIGKIDGIKRVARDLNDQPGFLSFGPYIDLKQGRYKMVLKYSAKANTGSFVGYVDMGYFNHIIDFTREDYPSFIKSIKGLSAREQQGRWSDARLNRTVSITTTDPLPKKFLLKLEGIAFGDNIGQKMPIKIGTKTYEIILKAQYNESVMVQLDDEKTSTITFIPPNPQSPSKEDLRKIAVGFEKFSIIADEDSIISLHKEDIANAKNGSISAILDIPASGLPQFEARVWYSGKGELEIHSLEILKLTSE